MSVNSNRLKGKIISDIRTAEQRKQLSTNTDHRLCPLDTQPNQDSLSPEKIQVMEKFFKPVHSPCVPDDIQPQKHHHHHQHSQLPRCTMFDDSDINTDESHGHNCRHYQHDSPHHDARRRHQPQQFHYSEEDELLYNNYTPVTLSMASSSSLSSSSSSSSSSSWCTEVRGNNPFSLHHAERPQHSLSCSNIPDMHRGFREDNSSEPIVFATIKHGKKDSISSEPHGNSQRGGRRGFASLDQGHSRSEEGLLQGNESDLEGKPSRVTHTNYGPLYKTVSLNRSLAFSEEDILLGVTRGPKRAVSSSQLPSKGILKNKKPLKDIRKAKSMEVLSPRVSKGQELSVQKAKGIPQVAIERARANFVQGKLQFSAFLDEITKQVISPSDLNSLGVNKNKTIGKTPAPVPQKPGPVKPQLPPKKYRDNIGEEKEQHAKQPSRHKEAAYNSSQKHSERSNPDKLISYAAKNHHGNPPSCHYPHSAGHNTHHGSSCKDRRPSPTGGSVKGEKYGKCVPRLTDGTKRRPGHSQPKQRHHRKQQPTVIHSPHTQHFPQHSPQQVHPGFVHQGPTTSPPSPAQGVRSGLGSESSSTKSDSSRTRDTASTATSHSSEQSGRHHSQHSGQSKQYANAMCDADHLQALQEENADLQQNLLQTLVCIESLEAELQRTREELGHVKEKYKSLLETHTGTKQANNLLGEHLHIASESLSSERKYLLNRVSQLSSELEDAHRTIAALHNINVPCLIKELLEKHFESSEAIQRVLSISAPVCHSSTSPQADSQAHAPRAEEAAYDKLTNSEGGLERVTAFVPFKHELLTTGSEACLSGQHELSHSSPFSGADISTAVYTKMAASNVGRPKPLYPQSQQQPLCANHADTLPNLQQAHVGSDSWGSKGRGQVMLLEQDVVDVTSTSAQQILDDFMQQLQAHKEAGGGKEQEWAGGAEQIGKAVD